MVERLEPRDTSSSARHWPCRAGSSPRPAAMSLDMVTLLDLAGGRLCATRRPEAAPATSVKGKAASGKLCTASGS